MLDMKLFRMPTFSGASLSIGLAFFSLFGAIYFLTQYLQGVHGHVGVRVGRGHDAGCARAGHRRAAVGEARRSASAHGTSSRSGWSASRPASSCSPGWTSARATRQVAISIIVLGFGMGFTMAPATESIMSSLPASHAGVGSAMNDAVRLIGGTFGVAILGSLLSSGYRGDMETETGALPAEGAAAASDSFGGASAVADTGRRRGRQLLNASAEAAFTGAMSTALVVASAVALAGAALAFTVLPARERTAVAAAPEAVPA